MSKLSAIRKTGNEITRAEAEIPGAFGDKQDTLWMGAITRFGKLGDQPELRVISGAVLASGLLAANRRLLLAGARMLIAHELATQLKSLIKQRIDRTRPHSAKTHSQRKVKLGQSKAKKKTSFPSGHSAGAVAVARAFSREYPEHQKTAMGAAVLVAAAQVPRCAHYPTDVAAGITLGALSEKVVDLLLSGFRRGIQRQARVADHGTNRPSIFPGGE